MASRSQATHPTFLLTRSGGAKREEQSMMNGTKKGAIVTGASGGIGGAVARRLSRDGFGVLLSYAGRAAKAEDVVAEITVAGGRALAAPADVANPKDVERIFKQA